ncbi:MAG: adenosine kinase [Spirochaetales bacterium]|nr:adenosine kinase [Spirochaetales bacterium]
MVPKVYGIGNPLIDIITQITEDDLEVLGLHKGTMHLIDEERRKELLSFISDKEIAYSCGGSCPNTIITLASLGVTAAIAGMVGLDEFSSIYKNRLQELSVFDKLSQCGAPTGSSIILITPDSERTMNTYLGANRLFSPNDISKSLIQKADFFHFTGYMWDTDSQKKSILAGISTAKKAGTKISFDIADPFAVSRNRLAFLDIIDEHADIVFANNEEARILFDNYDAYECVKSMGKLCQTAIVKNGKHGSFICNNGRIHAIPVKGKDPVDTTGAGDVYAAGFLLGLCRLLSPHDSGLLASYLAGEIIGQHGAQFSADKILSLTDYIESHF